MRKFLLALLIPTLAIPVPALAAPVDIAKSADPRRAAMLAALHRAIDRGMGQPVKFVVKSLKVQDGWGFAVLVPRTPQGGPIDVGKTTSAEAAREGSYDGDIIYALLRQRGGGWIVPTWVMGPTDVAWASWPEEYGAPGALLGLTGEW